MSYTAAGAPASERIVRYLARPLDQDYAAQHTETLTTAADEMVNYFGFGAVARLLQKGGRPPVSIRRAVRKACLAEHTFARSSQRRSYIRTALEQVESL